jgi:RecJ-like exonuclease
MTTKPAGSAWQTEVDRSIGRVTAHEERIQVVDVQVEPIFAEDVTEVHVKVNGRLLSRMHPERARRLGLIDSSL